MDSSKTYVKSKSGMLKIFEIVVSVIAFACITVSKMGFSQFDFHQQNKGRYGFFQAVHIIGCMLAIAIFIARFISRPSLLFSCQCLNLGFCGLMVLMTIIAGASMVNEAQHEHESLLYEKHQGRWKWYTNNTIVAIVFNFVLSFMFLVDGILQLTEPENENPPNADDAKTFGGALWQSLTKRQ